MTPDNPMPEPVFAMLCLETLAGFDQVPDLPRLPFHWAHETVSDERSATAGSDDKEAADVALVVAKEAAELAVAVVGTVRPFLEGRGLIGQVTGQRKSWARGDDGEMRYTEGPVSRERLRLARFLTPDDAARLETVEVKGKPHEILAYDALLAELLEELGATEWADMVRATPVEDRWHRWDHIANKSPRAALAVCKAVWARVKAERAAPVATLMHVEHKGARYVQAPKVLGGIAWAFGTDGKRVVGDDAPGEVVDGDEYRAAPKVSRYVSRSLGLVPEGRLRQSLLPVETAEEPLAVRVLADSQAVVSGVGGKVALLLAVASPENGGLCRMTVAELCRWLWPAAKRGPQLRDRQSAVAAVRALRSLSVVLPNTVDFPLWQIAAPDAEAPGGDLEVTFGWSGLATAEELGGKISMLRGRFLLNLSGAMRLSADHALELRTYVHAAAGWNEARRGLSFRPEFAPKGTAEELAARVNALSAPTVQYLSEQGKGRRQSVADDKLRLVQALERLADEAGLIRLEKTKGARGIYSLLPPDALLEAYDLVRKEGRRPTK